MPFAEVTGSADGPTLTVIAGVHGCEYASMDGVRRWLRTLEGRELRGRVRAVPVLNVTAFAARTPFVVPEDGKNLNRSFPGDPAGTLAERLAYDAFTRLITGSDAYVDAHCGDLVEVAAAVRAVRGRPGRGPGQGTGHGLRAAVRDPPASGRARPRRVRDHSASAAAAGIPAITAEAGGCGLVEEHAVALHVAGLDGVLARLGMTEASRATPAPRPTYLGQFLWRRCCRGRGLVGRHRPGRRRRARRARSSAPSAPWTAHT